MSRKKEKVKKEKVKSILNEIVILLILSSCILIFHELIKNTFDSLFVKNFLSKIKPSIINDLSFFILFVVALYFLIKRFIKKSIISKALIKILFFYKGLYVYFRFYSSHYIFYGFTQLSDIKYSDVIFFFFLASFLLGLSFQINSHFGANTDNTDDVFLDEAITESKDDILDRGRRIKHFVNDVIDSNYNHSIAYGITGDWGSGKSSYLNMLENEFEDNHGNRLIILRFNPWMNIGTKTIIQEFFETIRAEIKPYHQDIYFQLYDYYKRLLNSKNGFFQNLFFGIIGLNRVQHIDYMFDKINSSLNQIDKKILVIIDDIDRLRADEIFEVLKLIRNSAAFDNFIYLVAYDKKYISDSLQKLQIPNASKFIEKIFIQEENLDPIQSGKIRFYVNKKLKSLDEELFGNLTSESLISVNTPYPLKTLRDAKRFLLLVKRDFNSIKGEVNAMDYINIKLLKFKFYGVYEHLFLNKNLLLQRDRDRAITRGGRYKNSLKLVPINQKESSSYGVPADFENTILGSFIKNDLQYDEKRFKELKHLILSIFPSRNDLKIKDHTSIIFDENFDRYFLDLLKDDEIPEKEFYEIFAKDLAYIKTYIEGLNHAKGLYFRHRIEEITFDELSTREAFEKKLKTYLLIGSKSISPKLGNIGIQSDILNHLIHNYDDKLSKKFYNNNIDELKAFIVSEFKSEEYSSPILMSYFRYNYENPHNSDFINKDEWKGLIIFRLKSYTDKKNEPTNFLWTLFQFCYETDYENLGNGARRIVGHKYFAEAKEIVKEVFDKNLNVFLPSLIYIEIPIDDNDSNKYMYSLFLNRITNVWGDIALFENYLKKIATKSAEPELVKEFTEFFKILKKNNLKPIRFDFKNPTMIETIVNLKTINTSDYFHY